MSLPAGCSCYLINLDRAPERLASADRQLRALGIPYQRVPAVDGRTLPADELARLFSENRFYKSLIAGEAGCYLSHVEAQRHFLADGAEYALILEDDLMLPADLSELIAAAICQRDAASDLAERWDVLKLYGDPKLLRAGKGGIRIAPLVSGYALVEYGLSVPAATTAALWTRRGAERFTAAFCGVTRPVDCDLQHPWEFGLEVRSVHASPVRTDNHPSMIGTGQKRPAAPWRKLVYELRRMWPKLRHFLSVYGWGPTLRMLALRRLVDR